MQIYNNVYDLQTLYLIIILKLVLLAECSFVWENAYGFYGAIYLLPF